MYELHFPKLRFWAKYILFHIQTRIHSLNRRIGRKQLDIMPTYYYVQNQGKQIMQSQENGQKLQFGQFSDDFQAKYLEISNFSKKYASMKLKVIFSTNFRPKTKKIVWAVFEKIIKVSDFGLIWRLFHKYLQSKKFFQKSGSVTFLPL